MASTLWSIIDLHANITPRTMPVVAKLRGFPGCSDPEIRRLVLATGLSTDFSPPSGSSVSLP